MGPGAPRRRRVMPPAPRLAVLSHSAVEPSHRRKWEQIAAAGWDVLLLTPRSWPEGGRVVRARPGRFGGVIHEALPSLWSGRVVRWIPLGLGSAIRRFRPDLVHAEEEPFSASCAVALRAARRAAVPFSFFTWENLWRDYRWPQSQWLRAVIRGAAGAIAGNREAARLLRRRGFRGSVAVLPQYGVPETFRPRDRAACRRALGWPASGRLVGFIGRLLPEKGVETLLAAAWRLPNRVSVAIVGSGPHEAELRRLAAVTLGARARFLPAVPRERVATVMGALDVLVLPSRTTAEWKEQFGRVLAEAMACGRWAVGSSSGEIPQVLGDRRLVFPEGRAGALARLLRRVLDRPPPAALRRRAVALYSDAAVARATASFLRAIRSDR
jgi:glycosyltransferase involved in cell wall biosynthesis